MPSIAILGAGAMGSRLANASRPRRLGGEPLGYLAGRSPDRCHRGRLTAPSHRRSVISGKVTTFRSDDLAKAMDGVDVVALSSCLRRCPKGC